MQQNNPNTDYLLFENIREIKQSIKELDIYLREHMEEESRNITDIRVQLEGIRTRNKMHNSIIAFIVSTVVSLAAKYL